MKTKEKVTLGKFSISLSPEIKALIQVRAASLDLTVSQYMRRLFNADLVEKPKI